MTVIFDVGSAHQENVPDAQHLRSEFSARDCRMVVGISTSSAHAYLDPGTGSIILQVLLGGVAGVALVGKLYWHKFRSLIGAGRHVEKVEQLSDKRSVDADDCNRQ